MKARRSDVYYAIDSERDYQAQLVRNDLKHQSPMEALGIIEEICARMRAAFYDNVGQPSMDYVRKIAGVAVRTMEDHGAPQRKGFERPINPEGEEGLTLPDVELVSAKVHGAWIASKLAKGVTTRLSETGEELMVDYNLLSEAAKDLDRNTVKAVYAAIEAADGGQTT